MNQHALPPAGGGYPVIAAAGRIVNPMEPEGLGSLVMRLTDDPDAQATGREVVACIQAACVEEDLEDVSILLTLFPSVVCRVPEFHPLFLDLFERDRKAFNRLLRLPKKGAGRPREDELAFVALIEYVMDAQHFERAADAIEWMLEHRGALHLPHDYLPAAKTLQNKHAALGEYYRLWSRSIYVAPELLTLMPPIPPGFEPPPEMIERFRYPPTNGSPWPYGVGLTISNPSPKK